jgi:hypothetical protein
MLIPALSTARRGKIIWLFGAVKERTTVHYVTQTGRTCFENHSTALDYRKCMCFPWDNENDYRSFTYAAIKFLLSVTE